MLVLEVEVLGLAVVTLGDVVERVVVVVPREEALPGVAVAFPGVAMAWCTSGNQALNLAHAEVVDVGGVWRLGL